MTDQTTDRLRVALLSKFLHHAVPGDIYNDVEVATGANRDDIKRMFNAMRLSGVVEKSSPYLTREASFTLTRAGSLFYAQLSHEVRPEES